MADVFMARDTTIWPSDRPISVGSERSPCPYMRSSVATPLNTSRQSRRAIFHPMPPHPPTPPTPPATRAGIVTCGGLCPGLNNVIRSLFRMDTTKVRGKQILAAEFRIRSFRART